METQIKKISKTSKPKNNEKGKEQTTTWNLETWNVMGSNGKEIDLNFEFKRAQLNILPIIETKKAAR